MRHCSAGPRGRRCSDGHLPASAGPATHPQTPGRNCAPPRHRRLGETNLRSQCATLPNPFGDSNPWRVARDSSPAQRTIAADVSPRDEQFLRSASVDAAAFFAGNTQCQRRGVAQSTLCSCLDLPLVSTLPSVLSSVVGVANDSVIQTVIPHAALRWARPSTRAAPEAVMRRGPWQEIWLRPSAAFGDHRGRCRRAARGRASPKPTRTEPQ
jgi:hypothetical protein